MAAAVGEVLERYSASMYDTRALVHATYRDIGSGTAVAPECFALHSSRQHGQFSKMYAGGSLRTIPEPFTSTTRTGWVEGSSLSTGADVLVPAPFVFLPYVNQADESYFVDGFSTGLACSNDLDEARMSAVCEVIERDALSLTWLRALALPRIRWEKSDPIRSVCESRLLRGSGAYYLFDATLDIRIPTVLALFVTDHGAAVVGSGTHPNAVCAAAKALMETAQARLTLRRQLTCGPSRRYRDDHRDVVTFADHGHLYTDPRMCCHLRFLLESTRESDLLSSCQESSDNPFALLQLCIQEVRRCGHDVLECDVTSDDLRAAGYHVMRVVVPGLQILHARHVTPFFGGRRLLQAAQMRPANTGDAETQWNRAPHPFL